jgi:hypothetical protein
VWKDVSDPPSSWNEDSEDETGLRGAIRLRKSGDCQNPGNLLIPEVIGMSDGMHTA